MGKTRYKEWFLGETPAAYWFYGGVLPLVILVLFADVLFTQKSWVLSDFTSDMIPYYLPVRAFGFSELSRGHIPFWNPYVYSGAPFFSDPETALFYPFNWHFLFLRTREAVNWGVAFHVFLEGLFLYLWAAYRRLNPAACLVSALVFMLGGSQFLQISSGHLSNICSLCWAPLIFLSIDGWKTRLSFRWVLLGIFAVTMQILAGHTQYFYYTLILAGIYALLNSAVAGRKFLFLSGFILFYAGAASLAAFQLLPTWEASHETLRGQGLSLEVCSQFFLPVENILTLIMPYFWGGNSTVPYEGTGHFSETSLFMGGLAFWLVVFRMVKPNKEMKPLLVSTFLTFIFSWGSQTIFFRFFYSFIPLFKNFRGTCKFDFLACLFLALLAGMGMDRWMGLKNNRSNVFGLVVGAVGLVSVLGGAFINSTSGTMGNLWSTRGKSLVFFGAISLALACLFFLFHKLKKNQAIPLIVVVLVLLELFDFARSNRPVFDYREYEARVDALKSLAKMDPEDYRIISPFGDATIPAAENIWGANPMVLDRYAKLIAASQAMNPNELVGPVNAIHKADPALGLLRCRYATMDRFQNLEFYPTHLKELKRVQLMEKFEILNNPQKTLAAIMEPGFDPSKKVLLENPPDPLPQTSSHPGLVQIRDISTDLMDISVSLDHPSLLLISDNYAQDWRIKALEVDQQKEYKIMPADLTLRAVPLSTGHHHFRMEYCPKSFEIGKIISEFSILAFLLFAFLVFKPHQRERIG